MNLGRWIAQTFALLKHLPRTVVLSFVGPACLLILGYIGWCYYGAGKLDHTFYSLELPNLHVTPQPAWIPIDVAEEVYRGSTLDNVSLLNHQAAETIAHAFNMHPWVRRTSMVTKKAGAEVQVDVEYRKPVGMVWLDSSSPLLQRGGITSSQTVSTGNDPKYYLAVDDEGVLLPYPSGSKIQVQDFLIVFISPNGASTQKNAGERFDDVRVLSASKLCALLEPIRQPLRLEGIYVYRDTKHGGASQSILEVVTQSLDGRIQRVIWGHAPGEELGNEPKADIKLTRLVDILRSGSAFGGADISGL